MRPEAFAAVMATGIVSIAAADHGAVMVSAALAAVAVVALLVLVFVAVTGWRRFGWDLRDLDTAVGLFTYVAGCAVLAARFAGHSVAFWVLGGLALQGWLTLMPIVLASLWRARRTGLRHRAHGTWELVSVATSGLAIVFADAGISFWALIFWVSALVLYLLMTTLVCLRMRADPPMRRNVPPDHWILMGALAVAALAGDHVVSGLHPGPLADAVRVGTIVVWALATSWIAPLALAGWRRVRAWPAVFPLGMYSAATYAVSTLTGARPLGVVSAVFFWIAFVLWVLTAMRWRTLFRRSPGVGARWGPTR